MLVDPGELLPILNNLLENALYWVSLIRDHERVILYSVMPGNEPSRIIVRIDDTGPGIPDGDEDRIFLPGITNKPEGLGMGLTITSELVEQYGGQLRLIKPGYLNGASFEFDLPVKFE